MGSPGSSKDCGGLIPSALLQEGANVMLLSNLWTQAGPFNAVHLPLLQIALQGGLHPHPDGRVRHHPRLQGGGPRAALPRGLAHAAAAAQPNDAGQPALGRPHAQRKDIERKLDERGAKTMLEHGERMYPANSALLAEAVAMEAEEARRGDGGRGGTPAREPTLASDAEGTWRATLPRSPSRRRGVAAHAEQGEACGKCGGSGGKGYRGGKGGGGWGHR